MSIGYETVVSYVPEEVVKREAFAYLEPYIPDMSMVPAEVHRLQRPDAAEFMGLEVAKKALNEAGLEPNDLDIVFAHVNGAQNIMPGIAADIHHKLGFRKNTTAFNVQQCCGSFMDASYLTWNLLKANENFKRGIVISVAAWETGGAGVDHTSISAPACGDGAAAAIVSRENVKFEFLSYATRTYGELYPHLLMNFSEPEHPELAAAQSRPLNKAIMTANEEGFGGYIMGKGKNLPVELIPESLELAGLGISDLDMIIPHQVNKFFNNLWIQESAKIGIPEDIWIDTWDKYGNLGGADVLVTMSELIEEDKIKKDSVVSLFSPGGAGHSPTILTRRIS